MQRLNKTPADASAVLAATSSPATLALQENLAAQSGKSGPLPGSTSGANGYALSLSELAYRLLERQIVTLQLQPGSVINERALIELTGMGRTPVREAIQRLAWEGLMEVRPRSGIAITALDPKDFTKVLDARAGVEQVLARDAVRYSGANEHERLHQAAVAMKQAALDQDLNGFLDADKAFDDVLGTASLNPYATRLAAPLQSHSRRFWYRLRRDSSLQDSSHAHTRMIEAIMQRDEEAAVASAVALISYLRTLTP